MNVRGKPPVEVADPKLFFQVVRAAFGQRRKTLLNGLVTLMGSRVSKDALRQAILDSGLQESIRGERLGFEDFANLTEKLRHL